MRNSLSRRTFLGAGLASMMPLQGLRASPPDTELERLAKAAGQSRLALHLGDGMWSGPGWQKLLSEGREARVFMLGEDHGMAEIPSLAAQLFETLASSGYDCVSLEISDAAALQVDSALLSGVMPAFEQWLGG